MSQNEFDETAFHRGMKGVWNDETVYVKGVDFEERNIYIERLFEDPIWVNCSQVTIDK